MFNPHLSKASPLTLKLHRYLDKFPTTYNIWIIGLIVTLSGCMFGFDVSSMSVFVSQDAYLEFFNHPNSTKQGAITASMSGGCFLGCVISSIIAEGIGRRPSMMICSLLWVIGAIVQSSCRDLAQLIIGRIISGCGIGFGSAITPIYCSELSPASLRGFFGGLYQLAITFGIMVMFYISYGCTFLEGVKSFRAAWAIQMTPGVFLLMGLFVLPESPRWLANQGFINEGENILRQINKKESDEQVAHEIALLHEGVIMEQNSDVSYLDLFNKQNWRSSMVGISAQIWNQLTGMNVMMYYIVYIFEMIGMKGNTNLVSSSIQYAINFGVTLVCLPISDYVGRRPLMIIGGVVMMGWLFAVGGLLATYSVPVDDITADSVVVITIPDSHKNVGKGVAACSYLFVATFASTWAITSWAFFAEILPNRTRSKAGSVAVACDWAFNFALAMFTPPAFRNITWKTYFIFGAFCGSMSLHAFLQYPETKGKTLEDIDQMFGEKVPAWRSKNFIAKAKISLENISDESNLSKHNIQLVENVETEESITKLG